MCIRDSLSAEQKKAINLNTYPLIFLSIHDKYDYQYTMLVILISRKINSQVTLKLI